MTRRQAARVEEARALLRRLNFDAARSNDRSALTLLALLGLSPDMPWSEATNDMYRVVDLMQRMRDDYGKDYAPNSRETIRRQTLHQFVDGALILLNPDSPNRPVNSGDTCYQVEPRALKLLRGLDRPDFDRRLRGYLAAVPGLRSKYARERTLAQVPVRLLDGSTVRLTPGGQNVLLKQIVEGFCPRWTPGARVLYIGDAGRDDPVFEEDRLTELGARLDKHGKLPDLIVYMEDRNWLVLIEAASSHGPVDAKRHDELQALFAGATAGLVFVSCFPSRAEMRRHFTEIAWETDAWCADHPTHLIHFNGERFLGPYEE
jgi:adenine-specific DNA-methyltransferase